MIQSKKIKLEWRSVVSFRKSVCAFAILLVLSALVASAGYPASSSSGDVITGLDAASARASVTHAGTARDASGQVVTAGGRVLHVTAPGADPASARGAAYAAADMIQFHGRQMRRDIALKVAQAARA